jgi:hypothetical protein
MLSLAFNSSLFASYHYGQTRKVSSMHYSWLEKYDLDSPSLDCF